MVDPENLRPFSVANFENRLVAAGFKFQLEVATKAFCDPAQQGFIGELGPDASFLEFVTACCSCMGAGITRLQELSYAILSADPGVFSEAYGNVFQAQVRNEWQYAGKRIDHTVQRNTHK